MVKDLAYQVYSRTGNDWSFVMGFERFADAIWFVHDRREDCDEYELRGQGSHYFYTVKKNEPPIWNRDKAYVE